MLSHSRKLSGRYGVLEKAIWEPSVFTGVFSRRSPSVPRIIYFFETHTGLLLGGVLGNEVAFVALQVVGVVSFCFLQISSTSH